MLSGKLSPIKTFGDRKIYRFDIPKPDGSGDLTEYRGRTFIEREDGSLLETPEIIHFQSETDALAWLENARS